MGKLTYDPTLINEYARSLYRRSRIAALFGFLIGGAGGAVLGGAGAFAYKFATSLRFTVHNFIPGINVEDATRLGTEVAMVAAAIAGVCGAILGVSRGVSTGLMYRLTAQTALCQVEIERHLASVARTEAGVHGP